MKIDIVIPWVDGADPEWQSEFKRYTQDPSLCDVRFERYRDWNLLKYWFRGVEKFAPWVGTIHFITWGHVPVWLNKNNKKLNIVRHEDYIPKEYLPVFSSHPIEIFINRIKGLSENFIYFNDDLFFISETEVECFFKNSSPCDMPILNALTPGGITNIVMNDVELINRHFNKSNVLRANFLKWFNVKYQHSLIRTIILLPWKKFTGFIDHHAPVPYLKSTFEKVWSVEERKLLETANSRFRAVTDINQYVFRYWQFCEGVINPVNIKYHFEYLEISDDSVDDIVLKIKKQKKKVLAINDSFVVDFVLCQKKLESAFNQILPEKSSFEN